MKKTVVSTITAFALIGCLSAGALVGCSGEQASSSSSAAAEVQGEEEELDDFGKLMKANTLASILGDNGTMTCVVEDFDENNEQLSSRTTQWTSEGGRLSMKWSMSEGEESTAYAQSEYSQDGSGAVYTVMDEDLSASIYPDKDLSTGIEDEWSLYIEYPGELANTTEQGDETVLEFKEDAGEGAEYYYTSKYTVNASDQRIKGLEVCTFATEGDALLYKMVVKDINVGGSADIKESAYDKVAGGSDADSCKVNIVVENLDGSKVSSNYKVAHDTYVEIMLMESYLMYSDEAHQTEVDDIDVSGSETTVYIVIQEETMVDDGEEAGLVDDDSIEVGEGEDAEDQVFTSDDGETITLGEDGKFYDANGQEIQVDEGEENEPEESAE